MVDIEAMKTQHAEIGKMMADAIGAISTSEVAVKAKAISAVLDDISTRVHDHLAMEDRDVYPVLVESDDKQVRRTANQFHTNMGGLAEEFDAYFARYRTPADIGRDPWLFTYETRRMFERMQYRMRREETDLYPLLKPTTH